MIEFPSCPYAGNVNGGRRECLHPRVMAPNGVSPPTCEGCIYRTRPATAPRRQPQAANNELPCQHRGPLIETRKCDLCGVKGQPVEVFQCAKHGECSLLKRHSKVRGCFTCEDRE